MRFPRSLVSQPVNIGSNSLSSNCSVPMEGQPKAMASYSSILEAPNSEAAIRVASAPAFLAPSTTALAMDSVLPVPLQYTTAILLIFYPTLPIFILLTGYCEPLNIPFLCPSLAVNSRTPVVELKPFARGLLISVNLPISHITETRNTRSAIQLIPHACFSLRFSRAILSQATFRFPAVLCSRISFRLSVKQVEYRVIVRRGSLSHFHQRPIRTHVFHGCGVVRALLLAVHADGDALSALPALLHRADADGVV